MKINIRPWNLNDAESLAKNANNPNVTLFLRNRFPQPYTLQDAITFIEKVVLENPIQNFAIDLNGQSIGNISLTPQTDVLSKNIELGYFLGEPFWGNGFMIQAINQIIPYCFENFDVVRIFACAFGNNISSQKVLEKAGFKLDAHIEKNIFKNGEFQDELIYSIRK